MKIYDAAQVVCPRGASLGLLKVPARGPLARDPLKAGPAAANGARGAAGAARSG
jgi:hypothetical protein